MSKRKIASCVWILLVLLAGQSGAQPFSADIAAFKKQDSIAFPAAGAVVFAGSSSFTKWTDVQDYFPGYNIINRGFGGSSLTDLIRYKQEVMYAYQPKQVVIYCGENDIAAADSVTGEMVFERFRVLFEDIRRQMPSVPVLYISMKPSPARWAMRSRMQQGNKLIQRYLKKKRHARFLDVWDAMLGNDGLPMEKLFIADRLHMNAAGYAIWQQLIRPLLKK